MTSAVQQLLALADSSISSITRLLPERHPAQARLRMALTAVKESEAMLRPSFRAAPSAAPPSDTPTQEP